MGASAPARRCVGQAPELRSGRRERRVSGVILGLRALVACLWQAPSLRLIIKELSDEQSSIRILPAALALALAVIGLPATAQTDAPSTRTRREGWEDRAATKAVGRDQEGTKKAGDATKSGTKKAWDATKSGTKKAEQSAA